MSAEDFLDTNIFVYMLDQTDDLKRRRAEQLVRRGIEAGTGPHQLPGRAGDA